MPVAARRRHNPQARTPAPQGAVPGCARDGTPEARAGTGGDPAAEEGRAMTGTGNGKGARRAAGGPCIDVVFTFIDTIIAGDPGHPLSRVQNS